MLVGAYQLIGPESNEALNAGRFRQLVQLVTEPGRGESGGKRGRELAREPGVSDLYRAIWPVDCTALLRSAVPMFE